MVFSGCDQIKTPSITYPKPFKPTATHLRFVVVVDSSHALLKPLNILPTIENRIRRRSSKAGGFETTRTVRPPPRRSALFCWWSGVSALFHILFLNRTHTTDNNTASRLDLVWAGVPTITIPAIEALSWYAPTPALKTRMMASILKSALPSSLLNASIATSLYDYKVA